MNITRPIHKSLANQVVVRNMKKTGTKAIMVYNKYGEQVSKTILWGENSPVKKGFSGISEQVISYPLGRITCIDDCNYSDKFIYKKPKGFSI